MRETEAGKGLVAVRSGQTVTDPQRVKAFGRAGLTQNGLQTVSGGGARGRPGAQFVRVQTRQGVAGGAE